MSFSKIKEGGITALQYTRSYSYLKRAEGKKKEAPRELLVGKAYERQK